MTRVSQIVAGITYKPGWRFLAHPDRVGTLVTVELRTPDVDNPQVTTILRMQGTFEDDRMGEETLERIYSMVRELEMHELDEWFKYKGKHVHSPHPLPKG